MKVTVAMGVNSQYVLLLYLPAWVGDNCMHVLLMVSAQLVLAVVEAFVEDYWNY